MDKKYSTSALRPYAVIDDAGPEHGQYINSFCITKKGTWLISITIGHSRWGTTYTKRSTDRGNTWEDRVYVIEPGKLEPGKTIEMGQLLPLDDRIYQFHIQHTHPDTRFGELRYTVSYDDGRSWEGPDGPGSLYSLETPTYELSPNKNGWHLMAPGLIIQRIKSGECQTNTHQAEWLLPMNISTDPLPLSEIRSELVFAISSNILTAKDPKDISFEFHPAPPHGVKVPLESSPGESLGQEPQVVQLSDGRLFSVCRTGNGCIYYTVSEDYGRSWWDAQPLCYREGGPRILHPNCPCPLAKLTGGRYALLFCNNDGTAFGGKDPFDHTKNRQPVYISIGREIGPKDGQPLEFSEPRLLCSIEGFHPEQQWRDLTYGFFLEDQGEYYHFYNAVWRFIQINRVDPKLVE
ncbi:MAG: sialidase family protein [Armatimonadota bacterium]